MDQPSQAQEAFRVVAVFSVFNPTHHAVSNVKAACAQVDETIVVNDGSDAIEASIYRELNELGVTVIHLPENLGIASALNKGIQAARLNSDDLVITLDQDSLIPPGFVDSLVAGITLAKNSGIPVAAVVPEKFAEVCQSEGDEIGSGLRAARQPIQSGMMIRAVAISNAGLFREEFIIDLVDNEYSLRLLDRGWKVLTVSGVNLQHSLGNQYRLSFMNRELKFFPPRMRIVTLSTPFRYYYRARNRVILLSEYRHYFFKYFVRDVVNEILYIGIVIFMAKRKMRIARVIFRGIADGISKRSGKIPVELLSIARTVSWKSDPLVTAEDS